MSDPATASKGDHADRVRDAERHSDRARLITFRVLCDAATLALALLLAFVARFTWGWLAFTEDPDLGWRPYAIAGVLWIAATLWALAARGLYDEDTLVPGGGEVARSLQALPTGIAAVVFVAFLIRGEQLSRSWFLMAVALSAVLLLVQRSGFRRLLARQRDRGRFRRSVVLLVRPGEDPGEIPRRLAEFDVIASRSSEDLEPTEAGEEPRAYLLDSQGWDRDDLWETILAAGQRGASVFVVSGLRTVSAHRVTTRDLEGQTVMRVSPPRISGVRGAEKRMLDLAVALLLAIPTLIIGAVVALVVLIGDGRPVLYRQERLGRDGKVFKMWKFRSMTVGAEDETGPTWAEHDDPRRTRVGSFLRRSSLDELPQLWNVVRGHMSMVGPRPERPEFVERFSEEVKWYRYRLRIKPGLTGLAQALGLRGRTPLDRRVERDNWYIENWSLALDVQILLRTLGAVVRGENAE